VSAAPVTRARVVLHAAGIGVMSLVMSANGNGLPQLFFQRHQPERKALLLAVCLLGCTLASIAGVLASRRARAGAAAVLALLAATIAAEDALFVVEDALAYLALAALAQLGANALANHLDHAGAARAGLSHRRLHDASSNAARLLGMLAAPLLVTRLDGRPLALGATFTAAGAAAFVAVALTGAGEPRRGAPAGGHEPPRPLDRSDWLFFGQATSVYVGLYLLAANLIYVLRDVVHLDDAARRAGSTIVLAFLGALVASAATAALAGRAPVRPPRPRAALLVAPALLLALAALGLARGVPVTPGVLAAGALLVGVAYGAFLAEVREHASRGAREQGKSGLLTLFNNLGNLSSLVAFLAMLVIALLQRGPGGHGHVLHLIAALPVAGVPLLVAATRARP
jgi:hypothetical protein